MITFAAVRLRGFFLRPLSLIAFAALAVLGSATAAADQIVTLTFSGMYELDQVLDFYNGGASAHGGNGTPLGITFSSSAIVASDVSNGGHYITANEPSPPVVMAFNAKRSDGTQAVMNVPAGFASAFSLYYSSPYTSGSITIRDGANATGTVLATLDLPQTATDPNSIDPITNFHNDFSVWIPVGVQFSGIARSVDFKGATDVSSTVHGAAFDNITLGASSPQLSSALNTPAIVFTPPASGTTRDSTRAALSQDGSIEVFQSQQTDLTSNTANAGGQDIYSVAGTGQAPVLESVDGSGHKLIGTTSLPAVSSDGRVVAFVLTPAAVAGAKDTITSSIWAGPRGQPKHQVDMGMGSVPPNGSASGGPSLSSANATNQLVFCSSASNLVPSDGNNGRDVFLVDPLNPAIAAQRVSVDGTGTELPGDSCEPKLSSDGDQVVFSLAAPSLYSTSARQIVRKDLPRAPKVLITGQMLQITRSPTGQSGNADSSEPTIDGDGRVLAFTSQASNLDSLGAPIGSREVFVSLPPTSSSTRQLKRVRSGDAIVPNGASMHPQLSGDGATVVMQTSATNFFATKSLQAKAASATIAEQCGAIAITTNIFNPSALGSTLCSSGGRNNSNQNPTISGDGKKIALDSNAPQPGTSSSNSNPYVQTTVSDSSTVAGLSGDYSGQWLDPNQSGQGLVIDELDNGFLEMVWFVFVDGQPTWVLGVGKLQTGTGAAAGSVVVQMNQVGIYHGVSFPLGEANASAVLWGSVTLTFTDANTGTMYWTSSYPGFNNGTMQIKHFLPVSLPANDSSGAQVKACHSGNWKEPTKSGHGFEFEIIAGAPPLLAIDWFTFTPTGAPVWVYGIGPISGNSVQMQLVLINGVGANFPPNFHASGITQKLWGTATFTFTDTSHAHLTWNSTISGYGSGQLDLVPTFGAGGLARRACQ